MVEMPSPERQIWRRPRVLISSGTLSVFSSIDTALSDGRRVACPGSSSFRVGRFVILRAR
jgi:hypothetical protein